MASAEDLNANPLFQLFLNSDHYAVSAKNQYIVCVPAAESLKLSKINKELLHTHVLQLSPFGKDEYLTKNGQTVILRDNKLTAAKGFPRPRTVSVLVEELYYDDNFESFKVLRLNFPLVGKVPLEYYKAVTSTGAGGVIATPVEKRTLPEHKEAMEKILGCVVPFLTVATPTATSAASTAGEVCAVSMQRFVTNFNNSYVMVKGFIADTGTKVRDTCMHIRDEALSKLRPGQPAPSAHATAELYAAIESAVMAAIYKKVFTGLCELYAQEDRACCAIVDELQQVPMSAMGVRSEIVCNPIKAIRRMQSLNSASTPFQKLNVLQEVNELLTDAVDKQCNGGGARDEKDKDKDKDKGGESKKKDNVLTTDDVLPLMVYVLIQAKLAAPIANLEFLLHFHCRQPDLNISHLAMHLANFQGAMQYINSGKLLGRGGKDGKDSGDGLDDSFSTGTGSSPPTSRSVSGDRTLSASSTSSLGSLSSSNSAGSADTVASERDRDRDRDADGGSVSISGIAGVSSVSVAKARPASSASQRSRSRERESASQRERRPPPVGGSGSFSSGYNTMPAQARLGVRSSSRGAPGTGSADSSPRLPAPSASTSTSRRPPPRAGDSSNGHADADSKSSRPLFGRSKTSVPASRDDDEPAPARSTGFARTKSVEPLEPVVSSVASAPRPQPSKIILPRAFDADEMPRAKAEADLGDFLSQLKNSGDVVAGNRSQFIRQDSSASAASGSSRLRRDRLRRDRDRVPEEDEDDV